MTIECGLVLKYVNGVLAFNDFTNVVRSNVQLLLSDVVKKYLRQVKKFSFYMPDTFVKIDIVPGGGWGVGCRLYVDGVEITSLLSSPIYVYTLQYNQNSGSYASTYGASKYFRNFWMYDARPSTTVNQISFDIPMEISFCSIGSDTNIDLKMDFDWIAWAKAEKLKLDNYQKGKEYLFFDTSDKSKILGKGAILGASIGFTVNTSKYTLDDIISGTLSKQQLGKTFASGMAYCNGIIIKYGGFIGAILRNKIFKIVLGAVASEWVGVIWATYEMIRIAERYIPDGASAWDKLQEQFKDMGMAVSDTDGMLTLGYTTTGQQIVDNWANSSYTGAGGATATGASETGADIMEGINDIAGAIKNGLKAQGQSIVDVLKNLDISLTIPQGASVPLTFDTVALKTFFDTLKIPFDTLTLQEIIATGMGFDTTALKEYFDTLKVPFDTLSLSEIFASGLGLKIPEGLTLPISGLRDLTITGLRDLAITGLRDLAVTGEVALSGLRDINVTGIKDIVVTGIRDIVATIENPVLSLEDAAMTDLGRIADLFGVHSETITEYLSDKALRDKERWEKEKVLRDNDITNKEKSNDILTQEHSHWTTKAEGLTKVERDIKAWVNEHSQVEYTPVDGVTLKKGLKANPELVHEKSFKDIVLRTGEIDALVKFPDFIKPIIDDMTKEKTEEEKLKGFSDIAKDSRVTGLEALTKIKY